MTINPPIRRALISVSDKSDIVPFALALQARGVAIISTGGTATTLRDAGVKVESVDSVTGFPEGLDGRVKTLHPGVHAGILAIRGNAAHDEFLRAHRILPIDLICINLYPFQKTIDTPGVSWSDAIENIDVGGPAMIRAGAKNHSSVTVVTSPSQYDRVISELDANGGATLGETRAEFAAVAFARTSAYDAAIANFLSKRGPDLFPQILDLRYSMVEELRYGENPHQHAALYRDPTSTGQSIVNAQQLHGKQLSYNNINDAAWALEAVQALASLRLGERADRGAHACAVVVKHTNPCGGAIAQTLALAVDRAIAGDPLAAYGGILAVASSIDLEAAKVICDEKNFFEVIVAPDYHPDALELLRSRWTNVRLLAVGSRSPSPSRSIEYRSIPGGMLVQDRDTSAISGGEASAWTHAAGPAPSPDQLMVASVLESLCRFVTSNAVVVGGNDPAGGEHCVRLFGVGSGQVDRVSACRLALTKAGSMASGATAVGDAFFPFSDGPQTLIDAGVTTLVHPGGSKRDADTFELCNARGVTCLTTGTRHFRH